MAETKELSGAPSLSVLYPKALVASARPALNRVPGLGRRSPTELPDLELSLPEVELDRDSLVAYDRVCGFRLRDELSTSYLHGLPFMLSTEVLTNCLFPFPVCWLGHIHNRIERSWQGGVRERRTFRVRADIFSPHDRGTQFDRMSEAAIGAEPVW